MERKTNPMLTRKHFKNFAEILGRSRNSKNQMLYIEIELMKYFKEENQNFKDHVFLEYVSKVEQETKKEY